MSKSIQSRPLVAIVASLAMFLCTLVAAVDSSSADDVEVTKSQIAKMTNRNARTEERFAAEDMLRARPMAKGLPVLFPLLDQYASDPGCGTGRCFDSSLVNRERLTMAPMEMQFDHAINRTWIFWLDALDRKVVTEEIIRMIQQPNATDAGALSGLDNTRIRLFQVFDGRWSPQAEELARKYMESDEYGLASTAVELLARNSSESVRDKIKSFMERDGTDLSTVCHWLECVASPAYQSRWGMDEEFLAFGYEKLIGMQIKNYTDELYAEKLVGTLQRLSGQTFITPFSYSSDTSDVEIDERRRDHRKESLKRALTWWATHSKASP